MMEETRSRRAPDQSEAVDFCLQIAATNSALLTQHGSGKSGLHADLNPLAHAVRMTVVDALKAAARHVDTFADITAWNIDERPTSADEIAKAEAVRALGRELAALSERAVGQTIALAEFERIQSRLMELGFALKPHHALGAASAVADQPAP